MNHYKKTICSVLTLFSTLILASSCSNKRNSPFYPSCNCSVEMIRVTNKLGEKLVFNYPPEYKDCYLACTNVIYSNNKLYTKMTGYLPYIWSIDKKAEIIFQRNAAETFLKKNNAGFLNENLEELEYVPEREEIIFYLYFDLESNLPVDEEWRIVFTLEEYMGTISERNLNYNGYNLSSNCIEYEPLYI